MKKAINNALIKFTGHRIQKATRPAPVAAIKPAAKKPAEPPLPRFYDSDAAATINQVRPRTMTAHAKLWGLIEATRFIARHGIEGDIVECGVWRGGSIQAVALTLASLGSTSRHLHLFDTFEGMPPPGLEDRRWDGAAAKDLLEASARDRPVWAHASLDDVRQGMSEVDYPDDRIHFHKGMVEDTIPAQAPDKIALLRLDTDWYASTLHELEQLYDRLVPGGLLIIDDYGYWKGSRQATDEFIAARGLTLFLAPLGSGRVAMKPL